MKKKTYAEKLKDPRWQKKRLEIMSAAAFRCEDCFASDKTLHVHHCFYIYGREPWDCVAKQLRCLCEDCHVRRGHAEDLVKTDIKLLMARMSAEELESLITAILIGPEGCSWDGLSIKFENARAERGV